MKIFLTMMLASCTLILSAQPLVKTAGPALINVSQDGTMSLSNAGASYFAKLSLECTARIYPHYFAEEMTVEKPEDIKTPDKSWPSFYGCFDWHSGVHNHWALVKLLKSYPNIPEAKAIREKLNKSFDAKNILAELDYVETHLTTSGFEFPYGTSWLLKVADELKTWNDLQAKKWLENLKPLSNFIAAAYTQIWPELKKPVVTGSHNASSLGLSFAYDYAVSMDDDSLKDVISETAKNYFQNTTLHLEYEPIDCDFMSKGLLIADLMRKVLDKEEYLKWLQHFSPLLFTVDGVKKAFAIQKSEDHKGCGAHHDGFHLNRIWCINGMLAGLPANALTPEVKAAWKAAQKDMWDYAQESIGKGNYDVDHWLSSFSVYAVAGEK